MEEENVPDDSSHYEISLTATQAFIAFVLLLLSLAASFAFGVVIGRGQAGERMVVRHEPTIVSEGEVTDTAEAASKIVELGVDPEEVPGATATSTAEAPVITESASTEPTATVAATETVTPPATGTTAAEAPAPASAAGGAHVAQLLVSSDSKTAEALAARLITDGFKTAYVDRQETDKGMLFRVRVRFASEAEARGAVEKLQPYSREQVWITKP